MSRISLFASAIAAAGLLVGGHAEAVQRTFVASFGNDANTAANCTFANPCRGFTAAQTVTDEGGEIVALDAAGYGAITIIKSISIISNPGFYAGISASSGNAVTIATAGKKVLLRGLNINGVGASVGINMTNGSALVVDNCVISNFTASGIIVTSTTAMSLRVTHSTVRNTAGFDAAIRVGDNVTADVSNSQILNNTWIGIWAKPFSTGNALVTVSDSIISGHEFGVGATGTTTSAKLSVIRSTVTNNAAGVFAEGGWVSVGYTMATGNGYGFAAAGGIFQSLGNNLVKQNTFADTDGTITVVGGT